MILTSVLPSYAQALAQKPNFRQPSIPSDYFSSFREISSPKDNVLWQQATYTAIMEKFRNEESQILPLLEFTPEGQERAETKPLIDYGEFKTEYLKKLNEQEKEYIKKAKSAEEIRLIKDFFVKASQDDEAIQKIWSFRLSWCLF